MSDDPRISRTEIRRLEQYRDRWSSFGAHTGIEAISEMLSPAQLRQIPIFDGYDDGFLTRIAPDVAIARWTAGAVVFEAGTYVDLAFYVAEGSVEAFVGEGVAMPPAVRPIFDVERTMIRSAITGWPADAEPSFETAAIPIGASVLGGPATVAKSSRRPSEITFLATTDFFLPRGGSVLLGVGELFGEIGAMSGWPQSVTVRTASECLLVQVKVAALRLMKRRSSALKDRLDSLYRQRSLAAHLQATPLFDGCPPAFLDELKETVELVSCGPGEVIAQEGTPAESLYLVRSGFVQLHQRFARGEAAPETGAAAADALVVNYLSKGMTLGEVELLVTPGAGWAVTASSVEHCELVRIPHAQLRAALARHPQVERRLWESAAGRVREAGYARRQLSHGELIATALEQGLVQGNSILVIDLERCTRCDDCVRACAATHGGLPRFVREGEKIANLQIASACYHCRDPVCLVGCPTGAIRRAGVGDVVAVDEKICIGCQSCAKACPYDAIVMHETGETWPPDTIPEGLRGQPRLVASKCDLCHTRPQGPACVHNCPNGCAYRVGSVEEFAALLVKR